MLFTIHKSCVINELFFILVESNRNIHEINIFNHGFLYTANDTTFILKDLDSIKNVLETLDQFYIEFQLCPNLSKCEIAGISLLKYVKVAGTLSTEKFRFNQIDY